MISAVRSSTKQVRLHLRHERHKTGDFRVRHGCVKCCAGREKSCSAKREQRLIGIDDDPNLLRSSRRIHHMV